MVVLLLENSEDDRLVFGRAVRKLGEDVRLRAFSQARGALEYLREGGNEWPALVFASVTLPGTDGIEFVGLSRTLCGDRDVRIVAMSSDASPKTVEAALAAGADAFLLKPMDYEEFVAAILRTVEGVRKRPS